MGSELSQEENQTGGMSLLGVRYEGLAGDSALANSVSWKEAVEGDTDSWVSSRSANEKVSGYQGFERGSTQVGRPFEVTVVMAVVNHTYQEGVVHNGLRIVFPSLYFDAGI